MPSSSTPSTAAGLASCSKTCGTISLDFFAVAPAFCRASAQVRSKQLCCVSDLVRSYHMRWRQANNGANQQAAMQEKDKDNELLHKQASDLQLL